MDLPYHYTPTIWPMLASGVCISALGVYTWRRRSIPGALPLAIVMLLGVVWAVCVALELAATDIPTKIIWDQFAATVVSMPMAIARLCFVLAFAGFSYLLTRRNLALLCIPPLLVLILTLTNNTHHWLVRGFVYDGTIHAQQGRLGWLITGFIFLLLLVNLIILGRLFLRSPSRRWPVAVIIISMLTTHAVFLLDAWGVKIFMPLDPRVLSMDIAFVLYSLVLFRFHIFDPIPEARKAAIEQMREGMLVVDASGRIVDLNHSMVNILGMPVAQVRGREVMEILPGYDEVRAGLAQTELCLMASGATRWYEVSISPLKDRNEVLLGHLLLLHDVTEQKQAQAQLLEQQRALATLQERERLARELHDNAGQVLGYVSLQAQAIRKWIQDGETAAAEVQLIALANASKEAHVEIRESIFNLKTGAPEQWSFPTALQQYLAAFEDNFGIHTEMIIPKWLRGDTFLPETSVQLLRVIQEALSNARNHGHAHCVQVTFEKQDGQARIIITDDGDGFDTKQTNLQSSDHYGLAFMAERMEQIEGSLTIRSQPGAGTQVFLQVPLQDGKG